jgi:hypothetical protein
MNGQALGEAEAIEMKIDDWGEDQMREEGADGALIFLLLGGMAGS